MSKQKLTIGDFTHYKAGVPYIGINQVYKIMTCPQDWKYTYVEDKLERKTVGQVFTMLVKDSIRLGLEMFKQGHLPNVKDLVSKAKNDAQEYFTDPDILDKFQDGEDVNVEIIKAEIGKAVYELWKWIADKRINPLSINMQTQVDHQLTDQQKASCLGFLTLYGVTPNGKVSIYDWRFPARSPRAHKEEKDNYEPNLNHLLENIHHAHSLRNDGYQIDEINIVYVVRNQGAVRIKNAVVTPTEQHYQWANTLSMAALLRVYKQQLQPNPLGAGWKCSKNNCSHWQYCPASDKTLFQNEAN